MLRCIKELRYSHIKKAGVTMFNKVGLPICCGIKEIKHGKAFIDMKDIYSESIRRGGRKASEIGEYFVRFESSDGLVEKMDLWIKGEDTGLVSIWLGNLYIKV